MAKQIESTMTTSDLPHFLEPESVQKLTAWLRIGGVICGLVAVVAIATMRYLP